MALPPIALTSARWPDAIDAADAAAVGIRTTDGRADPGPALALLERKLGVDLRAALDDAASAGKPGEIVQVPVAVGSLRQVLLVGVGDGSVVALRRAGAALARRARGRLVTDTASGAGAEALRAHLEGLLLASYAFTRKSKPSSERRLQRVDLVGAGRHGERVVGRARTTAAAVHLARDLANTPSNEKDPAWLAAQARAVARRNGLEVLVRDERALTAEGFGGIVAVGRGSSRPPRLIELRYTPDDPVPRAPRVVLVGKGITFDSGGLSLKPREAMVPMKTDMAAGGAVIAVLGALRDLGVRVPVTGLVAAAENMPGAAATRPGDVIRHYGGRTVEVFNTDAEGRLVLADALAYADARLDPDVLVDMATLTGSASVGLGRRHGALYTADDELAARLVAAGTASGDRLWRMPLVEDYRAALDSDLADMSNISRDRTIQGGSITAALFLREFAGGRRWAHLDIAGPARAEAAEHEVTKGATGFGTRLLLRWLEGLSAIR
ncbi:MAG: leucyl aminopeptidase [Actinomycetota bacterium]|nr:leucyl aminopeptidase [Actinomycetota bacterium]